MSPRGEDGSLDAALAQKLLSDGTVQHQLLDVAGVFGHLHRYGYFTAQLVVYLRAGNRKQDHVFFHVCENVELISIWQK